MKSKLYLYIILILVVSNVHSKEIHDFDIACRIFTEAKNTTFNKEQRSVYIEDRISSRIRSKNVRDTYYIIFNLPPEERYGVFRKAAENELKRTWECPAAQELLQ